MNDLSPVLAILENSDKLILQSPLISAPAVAVQLFGQQECDVFNADFS
jgi:hypothetical protein